MECVTIGNATLYRGDCLEVLGQMEDSSVDAVITDPPYSSGGFSISAKQQSTSVKYQLTSAKKNYPEFTGDNRDQRSLALWYSLWLGKCASLVRKNAVVGIFTDWRQLAMLVDVVQAGGLLYRGIVPWNKTLSTRACKGRFRSQCEYVIWGSFGKLAFERGVGYLPGFYECRVNPKEKQHITGKPLALMHDILKVAPEGSTVLDPFMGSATTGVAALEQGKRFIGIEVNREYFDIACKRLEEAA